MKVWHFLFEDQESGEMFFVEAKTKAEAKRIIFNATTFSVEMCKYIDKMTPEESENYPFDVY